MEKVKVYLDEARNATIVCGNCGKSREIRFSQRQVPRSSLVKCSCGNNFIISYEKRLDYRKNIHIAGTCYADLDSTLETPVMITNISAGGLQFSKSGRHTLKLNQKVRIVFRLENDTINIVVTIRHISGDKVGTKIAAIDEHSRKIMGFYLMP